jgi:hypothetical protein
MPALLSALDKLREWARIFRHSDIANEWKRHGHGGPQHAVLHLDSNADWGTTGELVERAFRFKADLALFSTEIVGLPVLPTADDWQWLEAVRCILRNVGQMTNVLQGRLSRACQIMPILMEFKYQMDEADEEADEEKMSEEMTAKLQQLKAACKDEVSRIISFHLQKPWPHQPAGTNLAHDLLKKCRIDSLYDLLQVCSLPCTACTYIDDEEHAEICHKFERLCLKILDLPGEPEDFQQPDELQPAAGAKKKLTEAEKFFKRRRLKGPCEAAGPPHSPQQKVVVDCRSMYTDKSLPEATSAARILNFWRSHGDTRYESIMKAINFLIGLPAGNGDVERIFGKCKSVFTPQRKQCSLNNVLLNVNAPQLNMNGYPTMADLLKALGLEWDDVEDEDVPDE